MKSLRLASLFIVLATLVSRGNETGWTDHFQEAQAAYDAGQYEKAATLYQHLDEQGQGHAAVLFNQGNALYRLGRIGPAVAAYQRALYEQPRDPDIRANLKLVQQQVGALAAEPDARGRFLGHLSQREWRRLGTLAWWLAAGLGIAYWLTGRRTPLKRLAYVAFLVALLSVAGWWHWHQFRAHPDAIILPANVQALFAPMPGALVHFALPEGSKVSVRETNGAWHKVAVGQQEGWIPTTSCVLLSLPP